MKARGIWEVFSLCAIGLLFFANSSFVESRMPEDLPLQTVKANVDQTMAPKAIDTIIIKGMMFNPSELHVRKGDTVVWINKDIVPHNVTDFPGNKWTSGTLSINSTWKKQIDQSFVYYCSIHPTMKGKITVDP